VPLDLPSGPTSPSDISLKKYDRVILGLMIFIGLGVLGLIGWGVVLLLPTLVAAAENGILLMGMMFVLAVLALGMFNVFLNLPNYVLRMKMGAQALRRRYISGNPIAAIDVSIDGLQERALKAKRLAAEADGVSKQLKQKIRSDDRRSGAADREENEERLAQAARNTGRSDTEVNEHLIKAERAHRTVEMLQPLLDRQLERQKKIEEARVVAEAKIADLIDQKENLTIILEAHQADVKQSRALSAFFGARSKEMATIEIAVDEIVRQSTQAEAEIEQMLRDADPAVQEAQLLREADALAAQKRLEMKLATAASPKALPEKGLPDGVVDGQIIEQQQRTPAKKS
jgi:hypothetical protein